MAQSLLDLISVMQKQVVSWLRKSLPVRALKYTARLPFALRADVRERLAAQCFAYEFAVAAIFKDEARFLDEWLTFHHGVGASHFFLYDNGSRDDYVAVLRPWIERGLVTLTDWRESPGQRSAYLHCVRSRWREARWIAFIDVDEFLFSPRQVDVRPILRSYADLPAIFVYSLNFGSSGHSKRPALPVPEAYTRRELLAETDSGKSIVNPRYVRDVPNSHHFKVWKSDTRDTNRARTSSPTSVKSTNRRPVYDLLRIHHYWSRSIEDLSDKVGKGDAFYGGERNFDQHLKREVPMNAEEDLSILPIWCEILRRQMNGS
jgi:glycosyl transferase family 92